MDNMNSKYKNIITSFVLNTVLHNVVMSWILGKNKQLQYFMDKHNSDWITGYPWYNTHICKTLHGKMFKEFIRNARTYRYNLMCYIGSNEKNNPSVQYN